METIDHLLHELDEIVAQIKERAAYEQKRVGFNQFHYHRSRAEVSDCSITVTGCAGIDPVYSTIAALAMLRTGLINAYPSYQLGNIV